MAIFALFYECFWGIAVIWIRRSIGKLKHKNKHWFNIFQFELYIRIFIHGIFLIRRILLYSTHWNCTLHTNMNSESKKCIESIQLKSNSQSSTTCFYFAPPSAWLNNLVRFHNPLKQQLCVSWPINANQHK